MRQFRLILCLLLPVFLSPALRAQSFGRNQVRIRSFDWKVSSTEHFDIHYYDDSEAMVPFVARILERSYQRISRDMDTEFKERKPFFLYARADDMQQSNIVAVGDGTGGVTEAFKNRFMVFHDGSRQWLDTVTTHELVHVFQFHILISGFWKSARILKTLVYPLWMMEGMAEYYSWGLDDTAGEIVVRDAATSDGLIPVWKLSHFSHLKPHQTRLAYESGQKMLEFIEEEFGTGKVARMLKLFESRFETSAVLSELIGLDVFEFDRKWREYTEEKYKRVVRKQGLREPFFYGTPLTKSDGKIPEFNFSPVFTPDGRKMAYLTTRTGFPVGVMLKDLKTGRTKALVVHRTQIENIHMGNFTNKSRVLSISRDGGTLAFSGTKNHRVSLYFYDLKKGKLTRVPLPEMQTITGTSFSPDGGAVAFSGMKDGSSDIFLLDRESGTVRRLTEDSQDDQMPAFSADGKSVFYSSELVVPGSRMLYQRRLYRVDLAKGFVTRVLDIPGAARDPYPSVDGKRLLFSLEYDGFHDVYELDLETGRSYRLTRSIGGSYTPTYAPGGRIAFASFRRGDIHIYRGDRARFDAQVYFPEIQKREEAFTVVPVSTATTSLTLGRPAKSPFSTDLFLPAFFFSTQGGFFWTSYWQGSDLLGNHQVQSAVAYASGNNFLDYQTIYGFNKYRTKFSVGGIGRIREDFFDEEARQEINQFSHAEFGNASYPLDRFHRLNFSLTSVSDSRLFLGVGDRLRSEARFGSVSFVRDTVRGRYLVATGGDRLRLTYLNAPRVLGGNFVYQSASGEAHKYVGTGGLSALVFRALGIVNWGERTPRYAVGGIGKVRGYRRRDDGSRLALGTAEWRVPVFSNLDYYMWYIFPDFYFKAISLAFFTDGGYAWERESELSGVEWRDIRHGYGVGVRIHTFILQLFPLVLHFDYSRQTTAKEEVFYFYFGPLF